MKTNADNRKSKNAANSGGDGGLAHIAEPLRGLAVPIDILNLDAANARKHGEKNLAAIRASLERWGQRSPIIVQREGMVVRAGNGRVIAARAMGWRYIAAVVVDESAVEATAFAIADNRTAELAEWDDEVLARLLQELPDDARLGAGFDDEDLAGLLRSIGNGILPGSWDDQGRLDQKAATICPKCGHEWVA